MCGIWAFIELIKQKVNYTALFNDFNNIKHRGPDTSSFQTIKNVSIGFHRLAIMDLTLHANQPYILEDNERTIIFVCNGEIYNFKELIEKHNLDIKTNSDCMTIPKLYIKYVKSGDCDISDFVDVFKTDIKGEFAFALFEFDKFQNIKQLIIGRDEIGIRPLYINYPTSISSGLMISSEIKGMHSLSLSLEETVKEFQPGTLYKIDFNIWGKINFNESNTYSFKTVHTTMPKEINKYYINNNGICPEILTSVQTSFNNSLLTNIQTSVINSIKRRLVSERPVAFLLSGGVDSSLVAAISAKILGQPIKTFCCGMSEGTDLLYARKVAEHIGSSHTEVFFTPEEGLDAIRDVIWTTETWDTTTIRASVGQYLVCKHIGTKTDAKVVLVGEGPDEVCSSYLFNYYAPSGEALHSAALDYVKEIHMFDGRRADRCISRWGLEGRIALLDPEFISAYWLIPDELRHPKNKGIEKWWLRKAFDTTDILPHDVLWRKKEAFSDGVSGKEKSWFEIIQEHINEKVSDEEFLSQTINAPTKEAYYYKKIFIEFFGEKRLDILPHYWQPKWSASGVENTSAYVDPSARTLNVY